MRKAVEIDASQALVVNRQQPGATDASAVEQRLVRGPARFIPAAHEWVAQTLREFTADENSLASAWAKGALQRPVRRLVAPIQ